MFVWYDYVLFAIVLGSSCLIGIFFGCFGKTQTKNEYLFGGKNMKAWQIAISLISSHTGIATLAIPADTYRFGASYFWSFVALFVFYAINCYVFLPVFYKLQLTSTYEYLALRFDEKTRLLASFFFAFGLILFLPLLIYLPSLGFAAATGSGVHVVATVVCGICIFYTAIGGLKAVVWTETLQFTLTFGCLGTVLYVALQNSDGFNKMWNIALKGERLDILDFDLDPTKRDTFWIVTIGLIFSFTSQDSVKQGSVQKFLSLSSMEEVKLACFLYVIGTMITKMIFISTGLCMYAIYANCDPFTTKQVTRNDQLVPYFVMQVSKNIPGLSGLFISGVFCAALCNLSSCFNCVAGTIYHDFVSKFTSPNISPKMENGILKLIVVIVGISTVLMIYVVENLGGIFQLVLSLKGITDGPLLGIFTMGVLCRKFNSKGAFFGSIAGLVFMASYFCVVKYLEFEKLITYSHKPLLTDGCDLDIRNSLKNLTISSRSPLLKSENDFAFFRISFYFYTFMGAIFTMVVGYFISIFTEEDSPPPNRNLFSPIIQFTLPEENNEPVHKTVSNKQVYLSVKQALEKVQMKSEDLA